MRGVMSVDAQNRRHFSSEKSLSFSENSVQCSGVLFSSSNEDSRTVSCHLLVGKKLKHGK